MQDPVISRISQPGRYALPAPEMDAFTSAMAMAATAVSVVTTDGAAGKFGLTVSAVSSVSAEPPMVLACINRRSPLAEAVTRNKIFCINLLAAGQSFVSNTFAGRSSESMPYDFGCTEWYLGMTGAPMLTGAAAAFDCNLEAAHDAGTHRIIIGKVLQAATGEEEPLVYARRRYQAITDLHH